MDDRELFRKMDEDERIYAPQELPWDQQERVRADEDIDDTIGGTDVVPVPGPEGASRMPFGPVSATHHVHSEEEELRGAPEESSDDGGEPEIERHHPFEPEVDEDGSGDGGYKG